MEKPIHTDNHVKLRKLLRDIRKEAGLRQFQLGERLHKDQTFVSKYETGERRLDILELRDVCNALGISLEKFVRRLEKSLAKDFSK